MFEVEVINISAMHSHPELINHLAILSSNKFDATTANVRFIDTLSVSYY